MFFRALRNRKRFRCTNLRFFVVVLLALSIALVSCAGPEPHKAESGRFGHKIGAEVWADYHTRAEDPLG